MRFPKPTSEQRAKKIHTDDVHYPDLGSASDWFKENRPNQKHYQDLDSDDISMEFLRSILRRRFVRAQVATSRNVGCFLRRNLKRIVKTGHEWTRLQTKTDKFAEFISVTENCLGRETRLQIRATE